MHANGPYLFRVRYLRPTDTICQEAKPQNNPEITPIENPTYNRTVSSTNTGEWNRSPTHRLRDSQQMKQSKQTYNTVRKIRHHGRKKMQSKQSQRQLCPTPTTSDNNKYTKRILGINRMLQCMVAEKTDVKHIFPSPTCFLSNLKLLTFSNTTSRPC